MPNPNWIQSEYYVSNQQEYFHLTVGYINYEGKRRGTKFGVNRKVHKASGAGVCLDSTFIGKSDNP